MPESAGFRDRCIDAAVFENCSMVKSQFTDVNLTATAFSNVDLQRSRFIDVNLNGVSIENADITGLRILGYDVAALIRDHVAAIASATLDGSAPLQASD